MISSVYTHNLSLIQVYTIPNNTRQCHNIFVNSTYRSTALRFRLITTLSINKRM